MPHIDTVWQPESYDHIVRNQQEFENIWKYIRQNPVKAELSDTPESYPFFWQAVDSRQVDVMSGRHLAYPTVFRQY